MDLNWFISEAAAVFETGGKNIIVGFDRIDEVHKYDRQIQEKAIQGLFLAENELSAISSLSVMIFLRTDLYEIYDIQEKNKLVSRSLRLRWKRDELLDFLITRVVSKYTLPRVTEMMDNYPALRRSIALSIIFPESIEGSTPEGWLWSSLANGNDDINPRQLILLLVLTARYESSGASASHFESLFGESSLIAAMRELSELSFKELSDDFRIAKTFLANCRAGRIERIDLNTVTALFDDADGPVGEQTHQLERLGFLERVLIQQNDGSPHIEFKVPKLFTRGWSVGSPH